jgi:hypothetical protein
MSVVSLAGLTRRAEVVRRGQVPADNREHRQRERDVGSGRDRPSLGRVCARAGGDQQVQPGGDDHATDGGGNRHGGPRGVAQITGDELAFEFQAGDEEEDRQRSVSGPGRQVQRCSAAGPSV